MRLRPDRSAFLFATLFALLVVVVTDEAAAESLAPTQVDVQLDGETYVVRARAHLAADQRVAWEALTDYEHLGEFVPGVTRSLVLWRRGDELALEQEGVFSVFFFDLPVRVRLAVQHTPYSSVVARLAPGSVMGGEPTLRSFTGRYGLAPIRLLQRAGVRVDYDARFELAESLPALTGRLFGVVALRRTMTAQFEAMMREIERRQAAHGGHEE